MYAGSTLQVSWNFSVDVTIYIIRGTKGFDSFYDGETGDYILKQETASSGNVTFTAILGIQKRDKERERGGEREREMCSNRIL